MSNSYSGFASGIASKLFALQKLIVD